MLEGTLNQTKLLIRLETPKLDGVSKVRLLLDAQVEQHKQIVRDLNLQPGDEQQFDDDQGTGHILFQDGKISAEFQRSGDFEVSDIEAGKEGDEGNVSLEIKNADTGKDLCLWTIVAIGPAPRSTSTLIRPAQSAPIPAESFAGR